MAALDQIDLFELWNQSATPYYDKLMKKIMSDVLDEVGQEECAVIKRLKKGPALAGQKKEWLEEVDYPTRITAQLSTATLTVSGYLQKAAVNQASIQRALRVDTVLQRVSDGMQCKVSAITGITDGSAPWEATVAAWGNNVLSDDSGAVDYDIIGELWSDAQDMDASRELSRVPREVGTQIYEEGFQILHSRENTEYEAVNNEIEHQLKALSRKLARQHAMALLRGEPYYNSGYKVGLSTNKPMMCGISTWSKIVQAEAANANTNVNVADYLTKTVLNKLARDLWLDEYANYNSGSWAFLCDPLVYSQICTFNDVFTQTERTDKGAGSIITRIMTDVGKEFEVIADRYMRTGELFLLNFDSMYHGYCKNDSPWRKEIETKGRYKQWMVTFQGWGVEARKPRQIGRLYGITTS